MKSSKKFRPPDKAHKSKRYQTAFRLRRRLKKGFSLTDDERNFLKVYESETRKHKRPTDTASVASQPVTEAKPEQPKPEPKPDPLRHVKEAIGGASQPAAPPPIDVPSGPQTTAGAFSGSPQQPTQQPVTHLGGAASQPPDALKQAERQELAKQVAEMYCGWLDGVTQQCEKHGVKALPRGVIQNLIYPAAVRTGVRYLPDINSAEADAALTLGSGVATLWSGSKLKEKMKQDKKTGARVSDKASVPPSEAKSAAGANGTRAPVSSPPPIEVDEDDRSPYWGSSKDTPI